MNVKKKKKKHFSNKSKQPWGQSFLRHGSGSLQRRGRKRRPMPDTVLVPQGESEIPGIQHAGHVFSPVLVHKHRFGASWLPWLTSSLFPSWAYPLQTCKEPCTFSLCPTAIPSSFGIHPARSEAAAADAKLLCSLGRAPSYLHLIKLPLPKPLIQVPLEKREMPTGIPFGLQSPAIRPSQIL